MVKNEAKCPRTAENSILLTQKRGGGTGWSFLPFPPQSSAFCCSFDLLAALEKFFNKLRKAFWSFCPRGNWQEQPITRWRLWRALQGKEHCWPDKAEIVQSHVLQRLGVPGQRWTLKRISLKDSSASSKSASPKTKRSEGQASLQKSMPVYFF